MKLFLNNIFKGLLVSLLVILLGGFLYINVSKPDEINLRLISSSLVNQLGTESENIEEAKENIENNESKVLVEEKSSETVETNEEDKKNEIKEDKKIEIKEDKVEEQKEINTDNTNSNNNQNSAPKAGYAPNLAVASTMQVIETHYGKITAYGPDCYGCGNRVAHGEYVGDGNIYYQDKTFGNIRIVAGDESLEFGTIVRISGLQNTSEPIIAIVLDTGGDIGFNKTKQIYFDLLFESEKAAYSFGTQKATFEILRKGF